MMRAAATVLFVAISAAAPAAESAGYGPWRLGMSREEVQAAASHGPYTPVAATGGLETRNAQFQGKPITASFAFGPQGLNLIQLWLYEGQDLPAAIQALHGAYTYLGDRLGDLHSDGQPLPPGLTVADLEGRIPTIFKTGTSESQLPQLQQRGSIHAQVHKFHVHPQKDVPNAAVYASLIHSPQLGLYWVFLYTRSPSGRS